MPFLFKSLKSFITSFEVLESNAPVGSSAKITDGLLTIALAIVADRQKADLLFYQIAYLFQPPQVPYEPFLSFGGLECG